MIKRFIFWLEGIVEDDPLPDEIDTIVFKITLNGDYKYLELLGFEKEPNQSQIAYRPLEAQCFKINEYLKDGESAFLYKIKDLINEAFGSDTLKVEFKKIKIYMLYKSLEFLFEIS